MSGFDLVENDDETFEDVDDQAHSKLLSSIGRKKSNIIRQESSKPSAFGLSKTEKHLSIYQLLKKSTKGKSKELKRLKKVITKPLDKPLPKLDQERATRAVDYGEVRQEVHQWDNIVKTNRELPRLTFPLDNEPLTNNPGGKDFVKRFQNIDNRTPLEQQVYAALKANSDYIPCDETGLTPKETAVIDKLSAEEAMSRLGELRRHRVLMHYQVSRYQREKAVKSKRFSKMKTKYRLDTRYAELSSKGLADTMRLRRMEERASLRHRTQGKWANKLKQYAKHDETTRNALDEKLKLNKQLTKKPTETEDEKMDEGSEDEQADSANEADSEWQTVQKGFRSVFPKPGDEEDEIMSDDDKDSDSDDDTEDVSESQTPSSRTITFRSDPVEIDMSQRAIKKRITAAAKVNPDKFFKVAENHSMANSKMGKAIEDIAEAFADDDVVEDFAQEIEDEERKRNKPEVTTVGWGSWTGPGAQQKPVEENTSGISRKPKPAHVVFSSVPNVKLAQHQVVDVPYGFKSVDQFERSLRQPCGREFNTETSFKKMIMPRISLKVGVPIAPISKEQVSNVV